MSDQTRNNDYAAVKGKLSDEQVREMVEQLTIKQPAAPPKTEDHLTAVIGPPGDDDQGYDNYPGVYPHFT